MTGVVVRPGEVEDAAAIARAHAAAFPDYFLTHLGPRFLRRYYTAFLREPHTVTVGLVDGRIAGFVAGTTNLAQFRRDLYRPNLLAFPILVIERFLHDQVVRREVASRVHHVALALRSVFDRRTGSDPAATSPADAVSSLFSICVSPDAQGSGVADAVMSAYLEAERAHGATSVVLSVFDDNLRAIRFYERGGWREAERADGSILFRLDLS